MRHIHYLLRKYKTTIQHKIPIFTGSQSSIDIAKACTAVTYKNTFDDDIDIKTEVLVLYDKLKRCIQLRHVKAHQDDKQSFQHLKREAKLNVLMDHHAKLALTTKTKIKCRRLIPHLPHQRVSLKTCYDRIT